MNYRIPEKEVANVLSVYWQLLIEVESKTDVVKDPLGKLLVEGAYKVLNRSDITQAKPRWEKENTNSHGVGFST